MNRLSTLAVLTLAIAWAGGAHAAGDPQKGKQIFQQNCQICHTIGPGAHVMIGPPLNGVVGRKWASFPGFAYSPGLIAGRDKGNVWNAATLDTWLTKPAALVPGTKMVFAGLPQADQRQDVIAYLGQFDASGKSN